MTHLHAAWKLADMGFEIHLEEDPCSGKPFWIVIRQSCLIGNYTTSDSLITLYNRIAKRERQNMQDRYACMDNSHYAIPM